MAHLNASHDQDNPKRDLYKGGNDKAGDTSIPFASVGAACVEGIIPIVVVGTSCAGGPGAKEASADDEEDNGGDKEADRPPP